MVRVVFAFPPLNVYTAILMHWWLEELDVGDDIEDIVPYEGYDLMIW